MKKISRYKVELSILIPLIILAVISVITIFGATDIIKDNFSNAYLKQILWYILGFGVAYVIMYIGIDFLLKYSWLFYSVGIISLILLLLIGEPINNARCWFSIGNIATIQPSEFIKIILILVLARVINDFNEQNSRPSIRDEFYLLVKVFLIVGIPSLLTFLQPDTGAVIIYLAITLAMLISSGIRFRWFAIIGGLALILAAIFFGIYFFNSELFIKIFGTNFFYRMDRILDWQAKDGMQLGNALTAIGSAGLFGFGLGNTPIYFPEAHTDFIFSVYASNFGLIGSIILIAILVFFDIKIINIGMKSKKCSSKYVIAGIVGMILYQQVQSIGMNIGVLPIVGITLPFISYGGSSLISYMIIAGIIFNLSNQAITYWNAKR